MKTTACACFAMIVSAISAVAADAPRLVGEVVLMEVHTCMHGVPGILRMSPDGEFLLSRSRVAVKQAASSQPDTDDDARPKYAHQLLLHRWKTGKDKAVPIDFQDPPHTFRMSMNPFSADGKLLVLVVRADIDEDGDGGVAREEKVEPAVYDVDSGKLRRIGMRGDQVWATFDAAGKHLIFTVFEKRPVGGKMYIAPVDTLQPKALMLNGLPLAPRPGDTTCVFGEVIAPADGGPGLKLVLYDYVKDARVLGQPFPDRKASKHPFTLKWTADGRYLYYTDWHKPLTTEVWDMKEGRHVARLPECLALGPCGGPTTMVLSRFGQRPGGLLHDARSGSQEPLSDSTAIYPICTAGKYMVYERKNDQGSHILCRAEVLARQSTNRPESGPFSEGR